MKHDVSAEDGRNRARARELLDEVDERLASTGHRLGAAELLLVATHPSNRLRLARPASAGVTLHRLFASREIEGDAPLWRAALTGEAALHDFAPVVASPPFSPTASAKTPFEFPADDSHGADARGKYHSHAVSSNGSTPHQSASHKSASQGPAYQRFPAHWTVALNLRYAALVGVDAVLFDGYPGVLLALRSEEAGPFDEDTLSILRDVAGDVDTHLAAYRQAAGRAPAHARGRRVFAADKPGRYLGATPADHRADPRRGAEIDQLVRARAEITPLAPPYPAARALVCDARGVGVPFRIDILPNPLGLFDPAPGPGLIVCSRVPEPREWLSLVPDDLPGDAEFARLLPAVRYMHEGHHRGVTLPAIADSVHLSPFHFHRRFAAVLGITPKHFLYDCQIAHACALLAEPNRELEDVARRTGFAHQSHFTSRFRQGTGLTPTRWRRAALASAGAVG